jgi:hypothetical protein
VRPQRYHWLEKETGVHLSEIEHYAKEFGPLLLVMLGPIGVIAGAAIELATHWKTVSKTFDTVVTDVKRGWDRLEGDVLGLWHTVETDTEKGVGKAVSFVEGLPRDVERLFADADTWLVDSGEQVLKGLLSGLEHGEKDVLKGAEDIGKHVLHAISHPWEIFSPSKAAARDSANLVKGYSVGFEQELPGLLADANRVGQAVMAEFKLDGRNAGREFMVDFAGSITDEAHLAGSALTSMLKDLTKSSMLRQAFAGAMNFGTTSGGHPVGPGSSLSNVFNFPNARIEANDPRQLGRQLEMVARRKNAVRT